MQACVSAGMVCASLKHTHRVGTSLNSAPWACLSSHTTPSHDGIKGKPFQTEGTAGAQHQDQKTTGAAVPKSFLCLELDRELPRHLRGRTVKRNEKHDFRSLQGCSDLRCILKVSKW